MKAGRVHVLVGGDAPELGEDRISKESAVVKVKAAQLIWDDALVDLMVPEGFIGGIVIQARETKPAVDSSSVRLVWTLDTR